MGMECELTELFQFTYRHEFENGLIESEYDHVFMGISNDLPRPDPDEVSSFKYISRADLEKDLISNPEHYSEWFKICLQH